MPPAKLSVIAEPMWLLKKVILGPSPESNAIGETKKDLVLRHEERKEFWKELIQRISPKTKLHANLKPTSDNWIGISPVRGYFGLNYVIEMQRTRVELYIDKGVSPEDNRIAFEHFHSRKREVEAAFGTPLSWEPLDGKRACRIATRFDSGGYRSPVVAWAAIQENLVEAMIRFENALRPLAEKAP